MKLSLKWKEKSLIWKTNYIEQNGDFQVLNN